MSVEIEWIQAPKYHRGKYGVPWLWNHALLVGSRYRLEDFVKIVDGEFIDCIGRTFIRLDLTNEVNSHEAALVLWPVLDKDGLPGIMFRRPHDPPEAIPDASHKHGGH